MKEKVNQKSTEEKAGNSKKQIQTDTDELLEVNQRLKREIENRKRAEQITRTLFSITSAISTTKDLGELYVSIHRILGEVINLRNFYIALYDKEERRVSFPYFIDQFDSGSVYADQISEGNSLTGTIITTRKPLFLDKFEAQKRAEENRLVGTIPMSWMGVPLIIKEEVIGVMAAHSYEEQYLFDAIDQDVFTTVSDQVAFAIERKRNEQAIVASEKRYRNIIDSIDDGYCELDLKGNLVLVNQAMCKILGYCSSDLCGMNITEYMNEETAGKLSDSFNAVLNTEHPGKMLELHFCRQDGNIRYAETVVSAIRNEDGEPLGFRGVARDITQRRNAEKSRKILEEQLEQSQRLESLGTLAGGIAHDFNNLLMGIQGRTALMLNGLSEADPHFERLGDIVEYVESAADLTTRLLGFARGGKYEARPVDLNSIVEKSIHMFGRTKKEITITTHFKNDFKLIEVDANQIEQVLVNLLVNAGQAMSGGGSIEITTETILVAESDASFHSIQSGEYVQLTITDTGTGIDEQTMTKIFDPFFTTKDIGYGTGLGLAMVYGIIRNHSGAISVQSKVNEGTVFTILLPVTDKRISQETTISPVAVRGSESILLVDDEEMIINVGQEILAVLGYEVLTASSGEEALETYKDNRDRIDLLIIDMIMPRMGGGELFDRLKEINPAVNVLLSSGYSLEGQAQEILERGCRGFIQKPFDIPRLSDKIRDILK